jgi:hypothetical protein
MQRGMESHITTRQGSRRGDCGSEGWSGGLSSMPRMIPRQEGNLNQPWRRGSSPVQGIPPSQKCLVEERENPIVIRRAEQTDGCFSRGATWPVLARRRPRERLRWSWPPRGSAGGIVGGTLREPLSRTEVDPKQVAETRSPGTADDRQEDKASQGKECRAPYQ